MPELRPTPVPIGLPSAFLVNEIGGALENAEARIVEAILEPTSRDQCVRVLKLAFAHLGTPAGAFRAKARTRSCPCRTIRKVLSVRRVVQRSTSRGHGTEGTVKMENSPS